MRVVHTASLRLPASSEAAPFVVGEAIPATLVISHTRAWSHPPAQPETETKDDTNTLAFYYDLDANSDIWILGGRRRAYFEAAEDEEKAFEILLLPQRAGHLVYPSLDVRFADTGEEESAPLGGCELDYKNHGMAVRIVQGVTSSTVAVDLEGAGGAWIVEAERRSAEVGV